MQSCTGNSSEEHPPRFLRTDCLVSISTFLKQHPKNIFWRCFIITSCETEVSVIPISQYFNFFWTGSPYIVLTGLELAL